MAKSSADVKKGSGTDAKVRANSTTKHKETLVEMGDLNSKVAEILASVNKVSKELKRLRDQVSSSADLHKVGSSVPGVVRSFQGGGRLIDFILSVMPPDTELGLSDIVKKVRKLGYRTNNKEYFPNAVGANLKIHPQIHRINRGNYLYKPSSRPVSQVKSA